MAEEQEQDKKEDGEVKESEEDGIIRLKVDMHCDACARKVRKALKGYQGVEDFEVDVKSQTVVVKGKSADPLQVLERVKAKSGRKAELISPLPKEEEEGKKIKDEEENKEPSVVTVILKLHMHCSGCARQVKKAIMKMKGVQSAEPDLMDDKVIVKGIIDPLQLVEHVYKRTKKHAEIVPQEEEKEQKKEDGDENEKKEEEKTKGDVDDTESENKKNQNHGPFYIIEYHPAPQLFSDENPNACSVM